MQVGSVDIDRTAGWQVTVVHRYQLGPLDPGDNVNYSAKIKLFSAVLSCLLFLGHSGAWALRAPIIPIKYAADSCKPAFLTLKTYDKASLVRLLEWAGFKGRALNNAINVVYHESRGNTLDHNTNARTGDNSYGLFQINMLGEMGAQRKVWLKLTSYSQLFDPITNVRVAFQLSKGGKDFSDWPSSDLIPAQI